MFDLVPFTRNAGGLFDEFDRMLNENFWGNSEPYQSFRTDILEKDDKYILKADLPGFQKSEIKISVDDDQLTLSAEHKEDEKEQKKNYVRRERRYGAFTRRFDITGIDANQISAAYQDGVLSLELPKVVETKPESRTIEVK